MKLTLKVEVSPVSPGADRVKVEIALEKMGGAINHVYKDATVPTDRVSQHMNTVLQHLTTLTGSAK